LDSKNSEKIRLDLNYYVIASILIAILLFAIANALEPQVDTQLDFFEFSYVLGYVMNAIFSFIVTRRYWPSLVFGRAYLSLAISYVMMTVGGILYYYDQIVWKTAQPYPALADIFFAAYYPFAIYHLVTNIKFVPTSKKPSRKKQMIILIALPLGVTAFYIFGLVVPAEVHQDNTIDDNLTLNLLPRAISNLTFGQPIGWDGLDAGFYAGIYFVAATTLTFSWAIIGVQVFRGSALGKPWGLLLLGIGTTAVADVSYYYTSIHSYDRTNPIMAIWVLGCMLICYALYKHAKSI